MSETRAAYSAPDGTLTEEALAGLARSATASSESVDVVAPWVDDVVTTLADANSEADKEHAASRTDAPWRTHQAALTLGGIQVAGNGYALLRRGCGEDGDLGRMELTTTFSELGVDPVMWGELFECVELVDGAELSLDGALTLDFGGRLADFDALREAETLVVLDADLSVDGEPLPTLTDFIYDLESGDYRVRLAVEDGDVIYFVEGTETGFQDVNGRWICDFARGRCTNGDAVLSL